jgi:signal transduction histidine kinase
MKDSFIQLTAHELRTPLTLVYGYSRLLEDSPALKQVLKQDETTQHAGARVWSIRLSGCRVSSTRS